MYYTMNCGCQLEVDVYTPNGCCCGECYIWDYGEVENVVFTSTCESHTPLDNVPVSGVE